MSGEGETTIEGRHVDWMDDENDPGRIGVWIDDASPVGSVWMTDSPDETWMAEAWFGPGYGIAVEVDSFDDAVEALVKYAIEREAAR